MPTIIPSINDLLASLPKHPPAIGHQELQKALDEKIDAIVVLDDDPTGSQTVKDVPLLTSWSEEVIYRELDCQTPLFFILTNSRSLTSSAAQELALTIGRNIRNAAERSQKRVWVISRSDSTLRGHYPIELDALAEGLEQQANVQFIIPAFFEGGRYTYDDIHYVLEQGELIPASQTSYAEDSAFGYKHSDLTYWVEEKTDGMIAHSDVATISLRDLRTKAMASLIQQINDLPDSRVCIVNAMDYEDLTRFAFALYHSNTTPLLRTAASFVSALSGNINADLLSASSMSLKKGLGGLVIVGSYIPKTTSQVNHLVQSCPEIKTYEVDVEVLLAGDAIGQLQQMAIHIDEAIAAGMTVLIYTSRQVKLANSKEDNLKLGSLISQFLVDIVNLISTRPAYVLTKGGITSSDIATRGLQIKRAVVQGQIMKGVPVLKLGDETKFPGLSQIIFPGNVGREDSMTKVVKMFNKALL